VCNNNDNNNNKAKATSVKCIDKANWQSRLKLLRLKEAFN